MSETHAASYLFGPGSRPDRFAKAVAAGADRVILDLEDAVAAEEKADARAAVRRALAEGLDAPVLVRLNAVDSPWFADDLRALAEAVERGRTGLAGVVIPKLESEAQIARVRETLPADDQYEIIGLIESALGVQRVERLVEAGVSRLAVGAVDLSVDIGGEVQSPLLDAVYARIVLASRAARIAPPLASPPLELRDAEGIETAARRLASMGVTGQLCIHPAQVDPRHRGFAPSSEQIAWARRVLGSVGGSVQVDGQMVDKPVRDRAERILALAERSAA